MKDEDRRYVVAPTLDEAVVKARAIEGYEAVTADDLQQDEGALDTWFSSWLWPISLFDGLGKPGNDEISYYYPTSDLVTGPDIIFFWVARMIMAGYEYQGQMPFRNVYFTGIVRDKLGRKMSKSLGNSPDPLDLIERYGADGVRMGMMLSAPAGNDILFDESLCEQGRNFNNKIWNAFRLVQGWTVDDAAEQPAAAATATRWFEQKMAQVCAEMDDHFAKYRISDALMSIYNLFWDEFSSWYLEMVKPAHGAAMDRKTYDATLRFFDVQLRLLHPFMPFITEALWQAVSERQEGESIMYAPISDLCRTYDEALLADFEKVKAVIAGIRTIRLQKGIGGKEPLTLQVVGANPVAAYGDVIAKMANLSAIDTVSEKTATAVAFMVGTTEYAVPLGSLMDVEAELQKLQADLDYTRGFLSSVMKKLGNERFVANAPEAVVAAERKKQAEAESKIASLEAAIAALK